ncbi:hypothetical protein GCM10028787_23630 [Brachybacterium horti]
MQLEVDPASVALRDREQVVELRDRVAVDEAPECKEVRFRSGSPADLERNRPLRGAGASGPRRHSHSMVPGGLEVMSRVTRLISLTSLVMRVEMRESTS